MSDHTASPTRESEPASGSPGDAAPPDTEQLDQSLSAMTDLLLQPPDGEEDEFEGHFRAFGEPAEPAPPQDAQDAADGTAADAEDSPSDATDSDAASQLDEIQAAVAAAIEEAGAEPHRPVSPDDEAASRTDDAPTHDPADTIAEASPDEPTESPPDTDSFEPAADPLAADESDASDDSFDADEAMAAVAADLDIDEFQADDGEFGRSHDDPEPPLARSDRERSEPVAAVANAVPPGPAPASAPASPPEPALPRPPLWHKASQAAGEVAANALGSLATAFAARPRVVQHSVAWIGLWTLFNAGVVWGYLTLFRTSTPAGTSAAAVEISGAGDAPAAGSAPKPAPTAP